METDTWIVSSSDRMVSCPLVLTKRNKMLSFDQQRYTNYFKIDFCLLPPPPPCPLNPPHAECFFPSLVVFLCFYTAGILCLELQLQDVRAKLVSCFVLF